MCSDVTDLPCDREMVFMSETDDVDKGEVCVEINFPEDAYGLSRTRAVVFDENGENARLVKNCSMDVSDKVAVTNGMCAQLPGELQYVLTEHYERGNLDIRLFIPLLMQEIFFLSSARK